MDWAAVLDFFNSHFYNLNTPLREQLLFLDTFISYFYCSLYPKLGATYKLLLLHYNNSLLELFYAFRAANTDFVAQLFQQDSYYASKTFDNELTLVMVRILKDFIWNTAFDDISGLIRDVFSFESDLFHFMCISKGGEKVYSYSHDVLRLKALGFSAELLAPADTR